MKSADSSSSMCNAWNRTQKFTPSRFRQITRLPIPKKKRLRPIRRPRVPLANLKHLFLTLLLSQESLWLERPIALLHQHLDLAFGRVQLLLAGRGQPDTFFEELERL